MPNLREIIVAIGVVALLGFVAAIATAQLALALSTVVSFMEK